MKKIIFSCLFICVFLPARSQFLGFSISPEIDSRVQMPIGSYPFRTGFSHSARVLFNCHFLYVFRAGIGVGYTYFSHPLYLSAFNDPQLRSVKSKWSNVCIPLRFVCTIPLRKYFMPMVEFQSNLVLPQNISQVERYADNRVVKSEMYNDRPFTENIFRMGALVRTDDRRHDFAINFQLSVLHNWSSRLHFVGVGLNLQYYFIVVSKGIRD